MYNFFKSIVVKFVILLRRNVLRDPFLLEIKKWFDADGDNTLRLQYPLTPNSLVWDIGGYKGDFVDAIYSRYACRICVFEPIPEFHAICQNRFSNIKSIRCFNYGLSDQNGWFDVTNKADRTSFVNQQSGIAIEKAEVRSISNVFKFLESPTIDLLKINIEGGEFDVLPALIKSVAITKIRFLQIQFHNFIPDAVSKRNQIRANLALTHTEIWNFPFVWECWELKTNTSEKLVEKIAL